MESVKANAQRWRWQGGQFRWYRISGPGHGNAWLWTKEVLLFYWTDWTGQTQSSQGRRAPSTFSEGTWTLQTYIPLTPITVPEVRYDSIPGNMVLEVSVHHFVHVQKTSLPEGFAGRGRSSGGPSYPGSARCHRSRVLSVLPNDADVGQCWARLVRIGLFLVGHGWNRFPATSGNFHAILPTGWLCTGGCRRNVASSGFLESSSSSNTRHPLGTDTSAPEAATSGVQFSSRSKPRESRHRRLCRPTGVASGENKVTLVARA